MSCERIDEGLARSSCDPVRSRILCIADEVRGRDRLKLLATPSSFDPSLFRGTHRR